MPHLRGVPALLLAASCLCVSAFAQQHDYQEPHHLVREPGRKLRLVLEESTIAPQLRATEWEVFATRPLDHGFHEVLSTRLEAWTDDPTKVQVGQPATEVSPEQRPMLSVRVGPDEIRDRVHCRLIIELQSYTTRLVPGEAKEKPAKLSTREKKLLTTATELHDFKSKRVRSWMRKFDLERAKGESELAFGFRVLQAIEKEFSYAYPPKFPDRCASQVIEEGASDCGGLSALFVSVMRANRIPARVIVGRWTAEKDPAEPQFHVKAEFYAPKVGWVPIDGSGAVSWKGGADAAFGVDKGQFIVMHRGADLVAKTELFGKQKARWCQGTLRWAAGAGDFSGASYPSRWIVKQLEDESDKRR